MKGGSQNQKFSEYFCGRQASYGLKFDNFWETVLNFSAPFYNVGNFDCHFLVSPMKEDSVYPSEVTFINFLNIVAFLLLFYS